MPLLRMVEGTSVIVMSAGGVFRGITYFPRSAETTINDAGDPLRDGDKITSVTRRNVTETAVLYLRGQTKDVIDAVNNIERMLSRAENGVTVYWDYQARVDQSILRSRVYTGRVLWSDNAALRRVANATIDAEISIVITREPWMDATTQREIPLSSNTRGVRTGGISIYNNDTGNNNQNWVQAAATDIIGSAPAPARIELTPASGGSLFFRNVYLCNMALHNPTTFDPFLLGSASQGGASKSWTASAHATNRYAWRLNSSQIQACKGEYMRILAAFDFMQPATYIQAHVGIATGSPTAYYRNPGLSGNEVWSGSPQGRQLVDLGAMPIPPQVGTASSDVGLFISIRSLTAGSSALDFVMLMPARATRHLRMPSHSTSSIIDNGPEGVAYAQGRRPFIQANGDPVMLYPGIINRVYMLFDEAGDAFVPGRNITMRMFARSRKRSI